MKKIYSSGTNENYSNHRKLFEICPFCDFSVENKVWKENAVYLVLEPAILHVGCVAVWSECPQCFEKSWVHFRYEIFETDARYEEIFPKSWVKKVDLFSKSMKIQAASSWCNSLCCHCRNLHDVDIKYHAWRNCTVGMGPPETKCEQFSEKGHQ